MEITLHAQSDLFQHAFYEQVETLPSQVSVSEESFLDPITGEIVVRKQFAEHQLAKVIQSSLISLLVKDSLIWTF